MHGMVRKMYIDGEIEEGIGCIVPLVQVLGDTTKDKDVSSSDSIPYQ